MHDELTWCLVHNGAGATEVARPVGPAVTLVVVVECVGRVGNLGVGVEATRAGLDSAAVGAVAARVVQCRLEPRVADRRIRHAPARRIRVAATYSILEQTSAQSDHRALTAPQREATTSRSSPAGCW